MRSPSYALQAASFATLTTDPRLVAFFQALPPPLNDAAPRVYDTVPANPDGQIVAKFPYITIGEDQIVEKVPQITDEAYCHFEIWSRPVAAVDYGEAKTIEGLVRGALSQPMDVAGFQTSTWRFHSSLPRKEPDGVTRRIILVMCFLLTPAMPV
jgi:hypothetical protein